jgi:hypothetical protein
MSLQSQLFRKIKFIHFLARKSLECTSRMLSTKAFQRQDKVVNSISNCKPTDTFQTQRFTIQSKH